MNKLLQRTYPFLIAIYPVLALRNFNTTYVDFPAIARALLVAMLVAAVIWLIFQLIVRDWALTGVITSLAMIVIMTYGHAYNQIENGFGAPPRHSILGAAFIGTFALACWILIQRPSMVRTASQFLANVSLILMVMSLGQAALTGRQAVSDARVDSQADQAPAEFEADRRLPDIYLIVLDGHGRSDVLMEEFGYDNSAFTQALTGMGFYVAQCSQSNYASTRYSLTSMFQMDYIQIVDGKDQVPALKDTPVLTTLRTNGYRVIAFDNYASGHFDLDEDLRLKRKSFMNLNLTGGLNEFENVMLNTSLARLALDTRIVPGFNEDELVRLEFYEHYLQTKYILDELPRTTSMDRPKFVFAHILLPHIPHVFTPDGDFRFPEDKSKNGYRDNAEFIDKAIMPVIKEILSSSPTPPVIIVMGDHGPPATKFTTPAARMKNLMAIYASDTSPLYKSITPVNTFRILLNETFGTTYPLLDDVSYYAYQLRQLKAPTVMANTCE